MGEESLEDSGRIRRVRLDGESLGLAEDSEGVTGINTLFFPLPFTVKCPHISF